MARADEEDATKGACLRAYESSQLHRWHQELISAREELRTCASEECPALARTDCVQWLAEVDGAIPSVVFEATNGSAPVFDVTVHVDGVPVATQLDGRPVEMDPGVHTFRFERAGSEPVEQRLIVRNGEKDRLVSASFAAAPAPAMVTADVPKERPVPLSVYVTAAVGLLGIADFAVAGGLGLARKQEVESTHCAPFCPSSDVSDIKTRYAAADIGLGVGVAAIVTSGVLFLTRPSRPGGASAGSLLIQPVRSGAAIGWRGAF